MVTLIRTEPVLVAAWELGMDARAAGQARRLVREALDGMRIVPDTVDDAVLMVSELVGNAVVHGEPPFELILRSGPGEFHVEVVDAGGARPVMRSAGTESEDGRGLGIVSELSAGRCGCRRVPYLTRNGRYGQAVWFALSLGRP
ncbi:hypothetical protein GCM10010517_25800 [Streptosporangium fragile]|uniref:Histidine kinase/HSP90-like ATPase domain-containing protein n=1 Tax=Streptosporangium fragile TaxID=46186 RepID=A0ABN3VVG0_9ACTN